MAETLSPHYSWVKPDIGGDASTWGNVLNQTTDAIDSVVYANQKAGVQIGTIVMFGGATAPTNWIICDGSSLPTTGTYAALFAVIGYTHGGSGANFNLPDLRSRFPFGAWSGNPIGEKGGSYIYTITLANLPSHAHPIIDPPAHTHGAGQPGHTHTDAGHSHTVNDIGHAHGYKLIASGGSGVGGGGGIGQVDSTTQVSGTGITIATGNANLTSVAPAITVGAASIGLSTTQAVGSGAAMTIIPSYIALNFIIRFQ